MKVRSKLALATGLGLLILLGVFYVGGRLVVVFALKQAGQSLLHSLPEVRRSVRNELQQLQTLAQTAAESASLRAVVPAIPVQSFVATNEWDAAVLDRLNIDLFAVADAEGGVRLLYARDIARNGGEYSTWALDLESHLKLSPTQATGAVKGLRRAKSGLIMVARKPILAAIAPLSPAASGTPQNGDIVVVGRLLEEFDLLRRMTIGFPRGTTELLAASPPGQESLAQPPQDVVSETLQFDVPAIWRANEQIRARLPLYDVYGRPVLSLMVNLAWSFKGLAELALAWLTLFVACVGALFIVPMFLVQGRTVLNPLTQLVNDLQSLGKSAPNGRRIKWTRQDEFGVVARTIDEILDAVDREHRALVDSNEHMRALLAATPDLIFVVDGRGVLVEIAAHNTGRLSKFFDSIRVGDSIRHAVGIPGQAFDAFIGRIGKILDNDHIQIFEYGIKRDTGSLFWVEFRMVRLSDDHVLVLIRDITDRRHAQRERARLEEKMAQVQKTESLGVLAGGIAHDFNNILTAMLGNIDIVMRDNLSAAAREAVENIRLAMIRASTLTRQMLSYAGQGTFTFEVTDLNALIHDLVRLMKRSISPQAELILAFGDKVPLVEADATQIWQVVMNLLINASDAMASLSGTITLTTAHVKPDTEELDTYLTAKPLPLGDYAMIEVCDTGHGMDRRTIERIYDPFFTTKAMGRGLGLSACLGIIRAHNGGISVVSKSGEGTRFRILLPVLRDEADGIRYPEVAEHENPEPVVMCPSEDVHATLLPGGDHAMTGPGMKILVADDDLSILRLVEIILKDKGYEVCLASSGEEALRHFEEDPDAFGLALVDVTMNGGMSGIETCNALHLRRANLPTIIMSGFREKEIGLQFAATGSCGFLAKPFMSADLLATVRKILCHPPAKPLASEEDEHGAVNG